MQFIIEAFSLFENMKGEDSVNKGQTPNFFQSPKISDLSNLQIFLESYFSKIHFKKI